MKEGEISIPNRSCFDSKFLECRQQKLIQAEYLARHWCGPSSRVTREDASAVPCSTNTIITAAWPAAPQEMLATSTCGKWQDRLHSAVRPTLCDLLAGVRGAPRLTIAHCTEILRGQNTEFTYKLGTLTEGISSFKKMSHLNTIGNTQNDALTVFIDTSMRQAVTLPTVHTQHQTVLCTKMMPPS